MEKTLNTNRSNTSGAFHLLFLQASPVIRRIFVAGGRKLVPHVSRHNHNSFRGHHF